MTPMSDVAEDRVTENVEDRHHRKVDHLRPTASTVEAEGDTINITKVRGIYGQTSRNRSSRVQVEYVLTLKNYSILIL